MKSICLLLFIMCSSTWCHASVEITPIANRYNVFSGKEETYRFRISSDEPFYGKAGWRYSMSGRSIMRGEADLELAKYGSEVLEISVTAPTIKEGLVSGTQIGVVAYHEGSETPVAELGQEIWVFSGSPFFQRNRWLEELKITLFDPDGSTADVLSNHSVPYSRLSNADALADIGTGIIIVGENVSLEKYRGLINVLYEKAKSGIPVLCLAASEGEIGIPGLFDTIREQPEKIVFSRSQIIKTMDKRLDHLTWNPENRLIKSSIETTETKRGLKAEVKDGGAGWPWMEISYGGERNRLIFCGFGIIENWGNSPSPGYFFVEILKSVSTGYGK